MVFDYKAFAKNQEKLWAGLRAYELLKGPFTAPTQTIASNIFEKILYTDFAEIEAIAAAIRTTMPTSIGRLNGKSATTAFIDDIWEDTPPVQPAAPVLVGTHTKHSW